MENVDRMMIYSEFTPQLFMLPKDANPFYLNQMFNCTDGQHVHKHR